MHKLIHKETAKDGHCDFLPLAFSPYRQLSSALDVVTTPTRSSHSVAYQVILRDCGVMIMPNVGNYMSIGKRC